MGYSGSMSPHPTSFCWSLLGLSLLAIALLAAPVSTFADSRASSGEQRASQSGKQRSKQEQARRGKYQYNHYESENRVRDFHENPNRQPHFIENRLGFKIRF